MGVLSGGWKRRGKRKVGGVKKRKFRIVNLRKYFRIQKLRRPSVKNKSSVFQRQNSARMLRRLVDVVRDAKNRLSKRLIQTFQKPKRFHPAAIIHLRRNLIQQKNVRIFAQSHPQARPAEARRRKAWKRRAMQNPAIPSPPAHARTSFCPQYSKAPTAERYATEPSRRNNVQ